MIEWIASLLIALVGGSIIAFAIFPLMAVMNAYAPLLGVKKLGDRWIDYWIEWEERHK